MKTLILFWGWTKTDRTFETIIKLAPNGWNVYALNYQELIPHGNINLMNQHVQEFLQKNNIKNFQLTGHSVGGALAAKFASLYPDKVEKLYLIDSTGIANPHTFFSWFQSFPKHQKHTEPHPIYRILSHPILHFRIAIFSLFTNLHSIFSSIITPTTIIWGEKDELIPLAIGQKIHQLIPHSKLVILKDYTHDWVKEHPDRFWENVVD